MLAMLVEAAQKVEELGPGMASETKLQMAQQLITVAGTVAGVAVPSAPLIAAGLNAIVGILNNFGIFKHHKTVSQVIQNSPVVGVKVS